MKFSVKAVGTLLEFKLCIYSSTENVLTLKESFKRVVALAPKPIKLSLVTDEYLGASFLPKVHTAVLLQLNSSLISSRLLSRTFLSPFFNGVLLLFA
ncbi:hypothetical protein D3C76_1040670 [compost metagenome]